MKFLVLLLVVSTIYNASTNYYCSECEHCYCVVPEELENSSFINPCKTNSSCRPLQYYLTDMDWVKSNSILLFLPGVHYLSTAFKLNDLNNFYFVAYSPANSSAPPVVECEGEHTPDTVILCKESQGGFDFNNIANLTIRGIAFIDCGYEIRYKSHHYWNAMYFAHVYNLSFKDSAVCNSLGVGLYGYELNGDTTLSNCIFSNSRRPANSSASSGNIHLYYEYRSPYKTYQYNLSIVNSRVMNGNNSGYIFDEKPHAGGVFVYLYTTNAINITLSNVSMYNNSGYNGGNVAITYVGLGNSWLSNITIHNCSFLNGIASGFGAGLHVNFIAVFNNTFNTTNKDVLVLNVTNSNFVSNVATKVGAGAYVQLHENREFNVSANISFTNCHFESNFISSTTGRGGSAVNVINFRVPDYIPHHSPQFIVTFESCNFSNNSAYLFNDVSLGSSALYIEENAFMILSNSRFFNNSNCSGISVVHSNLMLRGTIEIFNNTAVNGGGIVLCANSVLHLSTNLTVNISHNTATREGGGIFNEDACLQAIPPCFFQVDNVTSISNNTNTVFFLLNNTAHLAGSALYGGSIDYCYYYGPYDNNKSRKTYFDKLFKITSADPNDRSNITSDPIRVCFCDDSDDYDCSQYNKNLTVYSGGSVTVKLVVVGQRNGSVPGTVKAHPQDHNIILTPTETRLSYAKCHSANYNIRSSNTQNQKERITLTAANNFRNTSIGDTSVYLDIQIKQCPSGFSPTKDNACSCNRILKKRLNGISCNITNTTIKRDTQTDIWWIGLDKNGTVIYTEICPFDYCVVYPVNINITNSTSQNEQCAHGRQGVVCGDCQQNLSMLLGSTHCSECTEATIGKAFGKALLFALFGILFILLIGILNINVTEGTVNAFIFYMNVVEFNKGYFDQTRDANFPTKALSMMVAWVNFDVGQGGCFYDGMTIVGKVTTQCLAPFYLWFLAGLIIYLGRKYSFVIKIFGKDTVKVLATIILFSYANLISSLIQIWSPTYVHTLNNKTSLVWTFNGNIEYFNNKYHLVLFILALAVAAVTLPYTIVLLFIQFLRKRTDMKCLFWVNKLKPFFDAYTGPYKDKFHFWTGFLLLIRIALFVFISASGNPKMNLTLIIVTMSFLLFSMQMGIYKQRALNVIETFSISNLIVLTALISFRPANSEGVILCVGSMFILFFGIVIYHILNKLSVTQRWGLVKVWLLDKRWPWMKRKQIRSLILPYYVDSDGDASSSDSELDPILQNAPPVARYDQYREPLIETTSPS